MNAEITFYKKTRGRIAVQFPEDLHYDFCVNGFFVEQSDNEIRFFKNNGSYEGGRLRRQDKDRPIPLPFNRGTPRDFQLEDRYPTKKIATDVEGYLKDACRPWRINDKGPNHEYLENPPLTMIFSYMKALRTKFNGKEIQR